MSTLAHIPRSRDHFSAISHLVGAALSTAGLIILIILAVQKRDPWRILGFSIFGVSLILLYVTSSTYHFLHISSRTRAIFRRLDHSFIYVLIAGTFTPLCITVLRGALGWTLLAIIWSCAIIGIIVKNVWHIPNWASTLFYIFMGWLAMVAIVPLSHALPFAAIIWLVVGGLLYTAGAIAFGLDTVYPSAKWFNMHDVFHLLVIGGSVSHFMLMLYLV